MKFICISDPAALWSLFDLDDVDIPIAQEDSPSFVHSRYQLIFFCASACECIDCCCSELGKRKPDGENWVHERPVDPPITTSVCSVVDSAPLALSKIYCNFLVLSIFDAAHNQTLLVAGKPFRSCLML